MQRTLCWLALAVVTLSVGTGCRRARARASIADEPTTAEKPSGVPGVDGEKIRLAMTAVFGGPNAGWGTEYYRGSQAYFSEVNSKGGIHGRRIEIVPRDDGYDPARAITNLQGFMSENDTFMIYGAVGTKIVGEMVPVLTGKEGENWFQFGNHTGGQAFREGPGAKVVFNVRPSYRMEAKTLVDVLLNHGYKKIAVFHQDDPYGKSGLDGVQRALATHNLQLAGAATHPVGQKFDVSTADQVKALRSAGAEAIISVSGQLAGAAFVRDARETGWNAPVASFSPTSDTFLRTLLAHEAKTKKVVTNNLIHSQIAPATDSDLPAVLEYRTLMDRRNPQLPPELQDANYRTNRYGFSSLEGFLAAKTLTEIFQRVGPDLTRARFRDAAESLREYDPGVGAHITWSAGQHEGFNKVWVLGVKNGAFTTADDVKKFIPAGPSASSATTAPTMAGKTASK